MTVQFACDSATCDNVLAESDGRIALELMVPSEPSDDDVIELISIEFGFTGSHHFCSMSCLSAWAMDRAIDDQQ